MTASSRPAAASCTGGSRRAWRRSGPAPPRASRRSSPTTTRRPAWPGARRRSGSRPGGSPRPAIATREATAHFEACLRLADAAARPARTSVPSPATRGCCSATWRASPTTWTAPTAAMTGRSRWLKKRRNAGSILNKFHRLGHAFRDGARIAFYEHGSGEPAIVFVNPIVYGLATFQPILERLCQEFRVITVDCRGVARSAPLVRPYSIVEHAEDLRAVIEAAGAAPVVGVGISRGSNQLLHLAHTASGARGQAGARRDADERRRVGRHELLRSGLRAAQEGCLCPRGRGCADPAAGGIRLHRGGGGRGTAADLRRALRALAPGNRPELLRARPVDGHRADPPAPSPCRPWWRMGARTG